MWNFGERKYFDTFVAVAPSNDGGNIYDLTEVPQGVAQSERVGNRLLRERLSFCGVAFWDWRSVNRANYASEARVRVVVFLWKDDTAPSAADIMKPVPSTKLQDACSFHYNYEKAPKYEVLWDASVMLNNNTVAGAPEAGSGSTMTIEKDLEFVGAPFSTRVTTLYDAAGLQGNNKVYCLVVGDGNSTVFYIAPEVRINFRLVYTDS